MFPEKALLPRQKNLNVCVVIIRHTRLIEYSLRLPPNLPTFANSGKSKGEATQLLRILNIVKQFDQHSKTYCRPLRTVFPRKESECGPCGAVFGTHFYPDSPPCSRVGRHSTNTSDKKNQNDCDEYGHHGPLDVLTGLRILKLQRRDYTTPRNAVHLQRI